MRRYAVHFFLPCIGSPNAGSDRPSPEGSTLMRPPTGYRETSNSGHKAAKRDEVEIDGSSSDVLNLISVRREIAGESWIATNTLQDYKTGSVRIRPTV